MNARVTDLGLMDYEAAWEIQKQVSLEVMEGGPDHLLLVEHPPVLTLGANFHEENLLLSVEEYNRRGIQVVRTDRGGDVTYHCPGQLVQYPIFDVSRHGKDLHKWLRDLEETQLRILERVFLTGNRFPPHTGAWVKGRKVAAIGVKIRRWVSLHGIALNCSNDLGPFEWIIPCGIRDFGVTSISEECSALEDPRYTLTPKRLRISAIQAFAKVFDLEFSSLEVWPTEASTPTE